jgi:lipopolysaccharide cholinephosphotransferase
MQEYVLKTDKQGNKVTVRDLQMVLLGMLKDIDALCRKHNIPYFLNGGSALGAVRHQGFIPWDDDADISMMASDYFRFLQVASELGEDYVVHAYEIDKRYNVLIPAAKIRKKNTYIQEVNTLLRNRIPDCDGVFVDVFVYDYVSENRIRDFIPRVLNQALMPLIIGFENIGINPIWLKDNFTKRAFRYGKKNRNSKKIGFSLTWTFKTPFHPFIFDCDDIYPVQYVPFEDTMLPIAANPHNYLCTAIAPSYMTLPPENKRFGKHTVDISLKSGTPEE